MTTKARLLLLLACGLGFYVRAAQAGCDPCNVPEPPAECDHDDDNDGSDFMPAGMILDAMPVAGFADPAVAVAAGSEAAAPVKTE